MQTKTLLAAALASGTALTFPAFAQQVTAQGLLEAYQAEGFDFIDISEGPNQIKVEAVEGTVTLEVVYDIATGRILESEQQATDAEYLGRTGFEIDSDDEDFEDDDEDDEEGDDEEDDDEEDDDEEDDDEEDDDEEDDEDDDEDDED